MKLIRNAEIIDGTGGKPFKGDVLIKKEKISAIGNFPHQQADTIIDARGSTLMPGFIDINTDSDHYLSIFTNPMQGSFLRQGVTTIIGGHCGSSLAPLLYGSLESIRKWGNINAVNVDWHTVKEFLTILTKRGLGVNFGTLMGHSTIRRSLVGEKIRRITKNEIAVFRNILDEGFRDGALGFSTGLGYVHSHETPYTEIKALVENVVKHNGLYATHIRSERDNIETAVAETIKLVKATGANTLISHFRPLKGFEEKFEKSLELIETIGEKYNLHFDGYPSDASMVAIYTLLPRWAKNGGLDVMREQLQDKNIREKILQELPQVSGDDIIIADAPGQEYLMGKTLGEFAQNQELQLNEALLTILEITKLRAVVLYRNINLDVAIQSLLSPRALIASNSPSIAQSTHTVAHERLLDTFPKYIRTVTGLNFLSYADAVKKITSTPAKKCNISDRGEIKEGKQADITIMKDGVVTHVFVNGEWVLREGEMEHITAGKILHKE